MPHVVLYEFLTGGGLLSHRDTPNVESLHREGNAMLASIAADFSAIDGITTTVILDSRHDSSSIAFDRCRIVRVSEPGSDCAALAELCHDADWTMVIAPEFGGLLESRLKIVESSGGQLLGPSSRLAAVAGNKQRTAEHLAAVGVPAPIGFAVGASDILGAAEQIGFPAIVKPIDGAGSQDVYLLSGKNAAEEFQRTPLALRGVTAKLRLERFHPGVAASVALLCGPEGLFPLVPCSQRLSDDGRFRYSGGVCPLSPRLAARATSLALRAANSLADPTGYIGIDMVLADDPSGNGDVVIEINPRLTTSYVGLRAVAQSNISAAMLAVAEGLAPELTFGHQAVEFDNDGTVRQLQATGYATATGTRIARRA